MPDIAEELEERLRSSLEAVLQDYAPTIELAEVEVRRPVERDFDVAPPHMFSELMVGIAYWTTLQGKCTFSFAGSSARFADVAPEEMAATLGTYLPPPDSRDSMTREQVRSVMRLALNAGKPRS